ncbi:MAG: sodium-dependent transporter [Lachnospiraceae bacterium]|nr:sodium-dependent transporter [Lachnospiraceae bacterium]
MEREGFKSRLGFLLVSAGCAIGIGNVWKFPYVAGLNGGGVFVLFYLLFLCIMGIPVLTMELAVGRASRQSAVKGYKALEPVGSKWHVHGWVCIGGCYLLMMYYTTVSGWMLDYFVKYLQGTFDTVSEESVAGVFDNMLGNPQELALYMSIMVAAGIFVCSIGIQDGLEKISKIMMLALLGLILVLAVHSLTLKGAAAGLKFYLLPDFARASKAGLANVITAAMNQAFFTLSIGMSSMEIFGSYMTKDYTLGGEAIRISLLDTFVAIISGLIIFPACFSYGVETTAGPPLIFITLPQVFLHMAGGRIWGTLFFMFMTFASFSTVIAVFENLIAAGIDNFGWSRRRSSLINLVILLAASLPCVFGFNIWKDLHLIGARDVLDSEDFIVSNLVLPLGSMVFVLFCTTKWGWGFDNYLSECNTGKGYRMRRWLKPYFKYVLPVLVLVILVQGLIA